MCSFFFFFARQTDPPSQWPAVFQLEGEVFKLEGVIYYVDLESVGSMGFLGGKERIRIPINSKHSSLEALKRHIIE